MTVPIVSDGGRPGPAVRNRVSNDRFVGSTGRRSYVSLAELHDVSQTRNVVDLARNDDDLGPPVAISFLFNSLSIGLDINA